MSSSGGAEDRNFLSMLAERSCLLSQKYGTLKRCSLGENQVLQLATKNVEANLHSHTMSYRRVFLTSPPSSPYISEPKPMLRRLFFDLLRREARTGSLTTWFGQAQTQSGQLGELKKIWCYERSIFVHSQRGSRFAQPLLRAKPHQARNHERVDRRGLACIKN
jgi:hypothetical protein